MTDYQERRLNSINFKIEQQLEAKSFFSRNYKTIILASFCGSAGVVALGFINDPKRLESPETYDYTPLIEYILIGFVSLLLMILVAHITVTLQCNYIIKDLEKEERFILDTIERNRLDFERYENFDEIGDED